MGKPDYEEFLSGIPSESDGPENSDNKPLSVPDDQRGINEPPRKTEPSNVANPPDPSENSDQPCTPETTKPSDQSSQSRQTDQASTSKQADSVNQSDQPRQSTQTDRANQPSQSELSNKSDPSKQADQPEQPEDLVTFSVRMPTGYIESIKAITWWERCTHRSFLEGAVDRYLQTHGQEHVDKIIADYHNHNS